MNIEPLQRGYPGNLEAMPSSIGSFPSMPPSPAPKDLSITCPYTGKLVIGILGDPASFYYEFDQTHQNFMDHKCKCQYPVSENDLEVVLSWYSKDLKATVLECYNKVNDKTQFFIFDVNSGGLKEVKIPENMAYKPTDQSQNSVMATIRVNELEHYTIERSEDGALKKYFCCKYGQYLPMPPLILNTLLLRDIEETAPGSEDPDPLPEHPWQEYFNSLALFKFKFCSSTNSNLIFALNKKTGKYKSFQYDSGQISHIETPISNFFHTISEIDLVPLYTEKFNEESVFFVENLKSQRIEQFVFHPNDRQFVQVYHPELVYNPRKIVQGSVIFKCEGTTGNQRFLIGKYPNGRLKVEQFYNDVNSWMVLNPREVRTIVWQMEEKEKAKMRRKRQRSDEGEGEVENGAEQAKKKKKIEKSRGIDSVSPNPSGATSSSQLVPIQSAAPSTTSPLKDSTSQLQNNVTVNCPNQQPSTSSAPSSSSQIPSFDDECSEFQRAFDQVREQERLKEREKRNGTASMPIELDSDRPGECESPPI